MEDVTEELLIMGGKDAGVLKRFMKEFFPYSEFKKAGIFTKEHQRNYCLQARRICLYLGLKTIFEYGAKEVRCHITFAGERPSEEPFITEIKNIYQE